MSDLASGKPQPDLTDLTRPFWAAAREGRLVMQKCSRCGTSTFHPKPWCIECGCRALEWTDTAAVGTVYSHTVSYSVAMNSPAWQHELPVILCLVDVDQGARMYAQVTHCTPQQIHVGMRVRACFEADGDGVVVPRFRPVEA
jgi:uncharacterized OB-fold protein